MHGGSQRHWPVLRRGPGQLHLGRAGEAARRYPRPAGVARPGVRAPWSRPHIPWMTLIYSHTACSALLCRYEYVNIDDCWANWNRTTAGKLAPNSTRFPSGMKTLADYVHSKGLKLGTCESVSAPFSRYPPCCDEACTEPPAV
eukprot:COSAG06_NODE_26_length_32102_cov_250.952911_27_plen_143_part_00